MKQQMPHESINRYAYIVITLIAIVQGFIIYASGDYNIRESSGLSGTFIYMPMLLAIFVPSAISYLVTNKKSLTFYINILVITLITCWIGLWDARETINSSDANPIVALLTLTVLFFFMLPWMQMRQLIGSWKIDYACLMGLYARNTLLGFLASAIGGLVMAIVKLASFLFGTVNLAALSELLDHSLVYWICFSLGFNISLVFMQTKFDIQLGKIASYIARFFLPLLNLVAVIFLIGLATSQESEIWSPELGSAAIIWFLVLNIILLNFVYGDGNSRFQFHPLLNGFVLVNIILLNLFSWLALYGISVRVNQYSWSIERLYAFTIASFLASLVLAYSIAVIAKRENWMLWLGAINKVSLLVLIATILVINSPIADFKHITLNSIMAGIENGKIKVDYDVGYNLKKLGSKGEEALAKLKTNPEYRKALESSAYSRVTLKEVLTLANNSPSLPESWWESSPRFDKSWYCTANYQPNQCLGFMADINQDKQDEVVVCTSEPSDAAYSCHIWQQVDEKWERVDTQSSTFNSLEERDQAWENLTQSKFILKNKEWLQIDAQ